MDPVRMWVIYQCFALVDVFIMALTFLQLAIENIGPRLRRAYIVIKMFHRQEQDRPLVTHK